MTAWFVYILECSDGSLYTGVTNNVGARLEKHRAREGAKYTRSRGVKKLVYSEKLSSKSEALRREKEIKSWRRTNKLLLIKNQR